MVIYIIVQVKMSEEYCRYMRIAMEFIALTHSPTHFARFLFYVSLISRATSSHLYREWMKLWPYSKISANHHWDCRLTLCHTTR